MLNYNELLRAVVARQEALRTANKADEEYRAIRRAYLFARANRQSTIRQLARMDDRVKHTANGGELGPRLVSPTNEVV